MAGSGRMRMRFAWVPGGVSGWQWQQKGLGSPRARCVPPAPRAGCTYLPAPTACPRSLLLVSQGSPTPPESPCFGARAGCSTAHHPFLLPLPTV